MDICCPQLNLVFMHVATSSFSLIFAQNYSTRKKKQVVDSQDLVDINAVLYITLYSYTSKLLCQQRFRIKNNICLVPVFSRLHRYYL